MPSVSIRLNTKRRLSHGHRHGWHMNNMVPVAGNIMKEVCIDVIH